MKDTILFETRLIGQKVDFLDFELSRDDLGSLILFTTLVIKYTDDFVFPASLYGIPFQITFRDTRYSLIYIGIDELSGINRQFKNFDEDEDTDWEKTLGYSITVKLDDVRLEFEFEQGLLH